MSLSGALSLTIHHYPVLVCLKKILVLGCVACTDSYMLYHFLVIWNISLHMHKNIAIMWGFSFRFCWVLCGTSACVCTLCRDSVLDFVGFYVEHLLACMHKSLAIMSGFSFCWVLYFTCWQNAQSI